MAKRKPKENFCSFDDSAGEEMLWYNYDVSMKKDYRTLINHLQKICRSTLEYDYWQRAAKSNDNIECPVCGENYYDKNLICESHHYPQKLSTIIDDILMEHIENQTLDKQTGLNIVKEIMALHIENKVSYINLCEFCHKKFHQQHPDVVDKIYKIFEERIKENNEEYEKSVDKQREEIQEYNKELKEKRQQDQKNYEEIKKEKDKEEDNKSTGVDLDIYSSFKAPEVIFEKKEYKKPESINIETKDGFEEVSINIDDLI